MASNGIFLYRTSTDNTIYNNYFNNNQNAVVINITGHRRTTLFGAVIFQQYLEHHPHSRYQHRRRPVYRRQLLGNTRTEQAGRRTTPDIGNGVHRTLQCDRRHEIITIPGCNTRWAEYRLPPACPVNYPTPTPTPAPGPSGSYNVVIQPLTPGTLPYDATFTGNTIPGTMESCHSYTVGLTVKNTGTLNWSSANGVVLISSSSNGFTFDPSRYPIPAGVVVQPGDSYTFPVTITVPCPMKDGTYQLRFRMAYTVQTKSGPVEVSFGDTLTDSVTVGAAGVKMGLKTLTPASTISSTSPAPRQFTTTIPGPVVKSQTIIPVSSTAPRYISNSVNTPISGMVVRNFDTVTGLLWTMFLPDE